MNELIIFLTTGVGLLISAFLIVVSILWLFVPFKIFAMKKNSDLILEALTGKPKEKKTLTEHFIGNGSDENWIETQRREATEKNKLAQNAHSN